MCSSPPSSRSPSSPSPWPPAHARIFTDENHIPSLGQVGRALVVVFPAFRGGEWSGIVGFREGLKGNDGVAGEV
jgi:hypothetical protein